MEAPVRHGESLQSLFHRGGLSDVGADRAIQAAPVSASDRADFEQARDRILSYLDSAAPDAAKLALR